jgi:hypothetical protein
MTQLYNVTKELIQLIKEVKPEINHYFSETRISCTPYFSADDLLTLIPQLFEGVENPEYTADFYCGSEYVIPSADEKISTVLLTRYFVDGFWQRSKEDTLVDLIDNINKYLN